MENNRQLPEIEIGGTLFIVDVRENKLREKANPENELYVFDMHINDDGYSFWYNRQEKSFGPIQIQTPDNILISIKRSEEHTSELQSLMRISYAVFSLKKNKQ